MAVEAAARVPALMNVATRLRIDSVRSTTEAGSGHPSTCCSAAEIMAALFFGEMRYDPRDPDNPDNDRFVLSKGHAAPILYAAWAEAGIISRVDLLTLRRGCPCATCRGQRDQGAVVWPRPGSPTPLRIEHAELHGAWGLAITWNDGHATGIFPFESLRDWSAGQEPFGPDSGLGGH